MARTILVLASVERKNDKADDHDYAYDNAWRVTSILVLLNLGWELLGMELAGEEGNPSLERDEEEAKNNQGDADEFSELHV